MYTCMNVVNFLQKFDDIWLQQMSVRSLLKQLLEEVRNTIIMNNVVLAYT